MALPEDLISKVRQKFSEDDSLRALHILSELQQENPKLFCDRILRCIVILARDRLEGLADAVAAAHLDWRDLISLAEYHWGSRVRLLEMPFGSHPAAETFKQWLVGRQIVIPWCLGGDEKWTIEYSDIRALSLEDVEQVKKAGQEVLDPTLYFAKLDFLCIRGPKEISVSKAIEAKAFVFYRRLPETNEFEFQRFWHRPKDLIKRGKW